VIRSLRNARSIRSLPAALGLLVGQGQLLSVARLERRTRLAVPQRQFVAGDCVFLRGQWRRGEEQEEEGEDRSDALLLAIARA